MRVVRVDATDSTNALAQRWLCSGDLTEPTCFVARAQSAGRGTRGREWASPRDAGLYLSLAWPGASQPLPLTTDYTRAAGVACIEALAASGVPAHLKPVNDILAGGGKLGGILTELIVEAGRARALIVGIGLNIRAVPRSWPDRAKWPCTSIEALLDPTQFARFDPEALLNRLVQSCQTWIARARQGASEEIDAAWERGCTVRNQPDEDVDESPLR